MDIEPFYLSYSNPLGPITYYSNSFLLKTARKCDFRTFFILKNNQNNLVNRCNNEVKIAHENLK